MRAMLGNLTEKDAKNSEFIRNLKVEILCSIEKISRSSLDDKAENRLALHQHFDKIAVMQVKNINELRKMCQDLQSNVRRIEAPKAGSDYYKNSNVLARN